MVEAKDQDMGDGMQCINHPFTKNPGGICPLCLQEKLGKLVTSSSFPLPKHLSSSSSTSSPSFRSDSVRSSTTTTTASLSLSASNVTDNNNSKLLFLLANKKKKMANIVFKRSHSTTAAVAYGGSDLTPRKRNGFWSFLHLHSYKHHSSSKKVGNFRTKHAENTLSETERVNGGGSSKRSGVGVIVEEDVVTATVTQSERRVSRSRSVGCGSRSFSGEFFERITHGFGDCTLRRVESHREGNNNNNKAKVNSSNGNVGVREIVRCGGIFGGFMIMTPSSSSSSSSSWVSSSSSAEQQHHQGHGGRNRSWGWAFASPMRAFSYSSSGKRGRTISDSTSKNTTPNLDAIPSLLTVRS
ncbi:hypothetical protein BRARA_B03472 [Brassica rapa]|uniref:Uncharacterized protein n=1 Tax=Brassica campestris TaxID=3711 RepID=A0A398AMF0_BRACM|nr:uncharacterized protein DDB_G0271670 [Brassica rapa]RID76503.1 hypothetical protein BRARA_B03472 [Brassica rapa]CAG7895668.1 unnamed protein product [Brassica rapa]VDC92330.1 unnamed protein product [Brassica rapa]